MRINFQNIHAFELIIHIFLPLNMENPYNLPAEQADCLAASKWFASEAEQVNESVFAREKALALDKLLHSNPTFPL
jgi:hypothetical protein